MIHKTAIIDPKAKIASNVEIGPYCVIGPNVEIDENTIIHSHVNISVSAKIGKGNKIYPFVSINDPQDLKYNGEPTNLIIGNNNKIREYVTINPGTVQGSGSTVVGNNNLIMIGAHIAHDCIIGNNAIIVNNVALGGHVEIGDHAIIGGMTAVHQFIKIGKHCMVSGGSLVRKDIPPYVKAGREPLSFIGINSIGLRRKNIPNKQILNLSDAYKEIFKDENLTQNLINLNQDFKNNELVLEVVDFLEKDKKRPICTPYSK